MPSENLPLSQEQIHDLNVASLDDLRDDYDALGRQLARRGVSVDAVKDKVATFSVAVPSWGSGRGGHALRQVPDSGRAHQHPREA